MQDFETPLTCYINTLQKLLLVLLSDQLLPVAVITLQLPGEVLEQCEPEQPWHHRLPHVTQHVQVVVQIKQIHH